MLLQKVSNQTARSNKACGNQK